MHWHPENSLLWHMDVVFGDDQMRAHTNHAAQNFAVLRQFVLNVLRLAPVKYGHPPPRSSVLASQ